MNTKATLDVSFQQLGLYLLIGISTLFLLFVSGVLPTEALSQTVLWSCEAVGIPTPVANLIVDYNNELFGTLAII